jgi:hypothetical protein
LGNQGANALLARFNIKIKFSLKDLHEFMRRMSSLNTRFRESSGDISFDEDSASCEVDASPLAGIAATMNCSLSAT